MNRSESGRETVNFGPHFQLISRLEGSLEKANQLKMKVNPVKVAISVIFP